MIRQPRQHSEKHLSYIRGLPCIICGDPTRTEAAHVRFADLTVGKRPVGKGEKPDDAWALPLCGEHHRAQHMVNERSWWEAQRIDALRVALALFKFTGNHEIGEQIVRENAPSFAHAE
jgi:hypothetical protein